MIFYTNGWISCKDDVSSYKISINGVICVLKWWICCSNEFISFNNSVNHTAVQLSATLCKLEMRMADKKSTVKRVCLTLNQFSAMHAVDVLQIAKCVTGEEWEAWWRLQQHFEWMSINNVSYIGACVPHRISLLNMKMMPAAQNMWIDSSFNY